jgi:hypothetical protein
MSRNRFFRWMMLAASGTIIFQTTGCSFLEVIQTGLLAALTGITYYLASNV